MGMNLITHLLTPPSLRCLHLHSQFDDSGGYTGGSRSGYGGGYGYGGRVGRGEDDYYGGNEDDMPLTGGFARGTLSAEDKAPLFRRRRMDIGPMTSGQQITHVAAGSGVVMLALSNSHILRVYPNDPMVRHPCNTRPHS